MSILRRLFGIGGPGDGRAVGREAAEPRIAAEEAYEGFRIEATPLPENGQFRLAATITKEVAGETRTHRLIRADLFQSEDEAATFAIRKAKQVIDERGDRLFGEQG